MDFDYRTMSRVLKVPDEKFRDKIYKSMEANLTTMKRELGVVPPRIEIKKVLIESFERILGHLEPIDIDSQTINKIKELEQWFMSDEFLHKKTPRIPQGVKIKEGIEILYGLYKAKGGLIRTAEEIENKKVGGFFQEGMNHCLKLKELTEIISRTFLARVNVAFTGKQVVHLMKKR